MEIAGLGLAALALAAATPAIVEQAGEHALIAGPTIARTLSYGPEPRQSVELFTRKAAGRAPLVVYLHGGGWSAGTPKAGSGGTQSDYWTSRGYAYATVAYRFVPSATVEEQLADIARAVALLRKRKEVDRDRVLLVGHSSGGHWAALLGTDPSYLANAGVPFETLKAVVLLDPAALDIAPAFASGGPVIQRYYRPAFSDDPARQDALSPMKHVEPPNAPAWLMLHDTNNMAAAIQGGEFAAGLIGAGVRAEVTPISGTTHLRLNDEIGRPGDPATARIDAFLAEVLPEMQRPRFR